MSFKIFSLQLLGKIKPVEKIEQQRETLYNDYLEYQKVEQSDELAEFQKLEKTVNSDDFKKQKTDIQKLQFKGSKEYHLLKEFEKLSKSKRIKQYFKVKGSKELSRYETLSNSEILKEYHQLKDYVENGTFQKEKQEIRQQVFKGSPEEKSLTEFNNLKKSAEIKSYIELHGSETIRRHEKVAKSEKYNRYLTLKNQHQKDQQQNNELKMLSHDSEIQQFMKLENSKKLKLYRQVSGNHRPKNYEDLKLIIESEDFKKREAFLKDKKKFEKSETYKKLQHYKQLAKSDDIRFYLKFGKSALYKNYLQVKDSPELKRYYELKSIFSSAEFRERKAYLEDKKKWEKSEEYEVEKKYQELKNQPHISKYFKYKYSTAFRFLEEWEVTFEDDFKGPLQTEKWSAKSYVADKLLGENYSLAGDLNIFTDGKNVKTNNKLTIETRKEKTKGKIWQMSSGFLPVELDYSSGLVSTAPDFWQKDGVYEVKVKFNPVKEVVSSVFLQGEQNSPRVMLLEMGTKNRLGISSLNANGKVEMSGLDISNLKKGQWYILTLEKMGGQFTWKINETEVLQQNNPQVDFSMHLNASSLVVHEIPGSVLPVTFEIDWVRCYRKKLA